MFRQLLNLCLFFFLLPLATHAQDKNAVLSGVVKDTLNQQFLHQATIALLRKKDSVLVTFTRTNKEGKFRLPAVGAGQYIVLVAYPNYADYVETLNLNNGENKDLGMVPVITKATLLQEVIVKQRVGAIRMKGDTTEYKADSFKVTANADVQELLRKMPGIQVNSKGEITAQGERVQKILVDGEEFFSDDPAVVTKNLRADAVDKVQAYDRKSDQATFTGIDDGQKIKTLNIQLKEDKKKGYFGKIEAGTDFDRYRYGKALANGFKGKRKLSGYLTTDNTKFESLNWDENRNYAGDANVTTTVGDDGGISMNWSGDEFSWGNGFPLSYTGGLHFSNKWNKDKYNTNNTYQFNQLEVTGITTTKTQNILPDTSFLNLTAQDQISNRNRHKITSISEWQIDSLSSLKLTVRGSLVNTQNTNRFLGQAISEEGIVINESNRTTTGNDQNNNLNNSLLWRKRFRKPGRSISANGDFNFGQRTDNGFLFAQNDFYNAAGTLIKQQSVDQRKANNQATGTYNTLVTYTEPLWKNTFLVMNYRLNLNRNDAERNTFSKDGTGKYEVLVDSLSNHFIFNTTGHTLSANFRYNKKKFNFSVGSGWGTTLYRMDDVRKNDDRTVRFNNLLPSLAFNYTPKQQRRMGFSYNGSTRNPNLTQIQPLIDNTDPLNITIGNPNLQQSFVHNFSLFASDYKVLKSRSLSFNANYSRTDNAISNANFIDSLGRRINQAINVQGNYNASARVGFGFDMAPSWNLNFNIGPRINRFANRINGKDNVTENKALNISMYSGFWSDKWINYWFNFDANYNNSISSIRPDIVTKYWSYNFNGGFQFKLKKIKTYIDLDVEGRMFQKTAVFAQQRNVYLVNTGIRKVLTKSDQFEVKLYVNDLFNQNQGIQRNANSNFITETVSQTIQRYALLSFAWNFSKNGKPSNGF